MNDTKKQIYDYLKTQMLMGVSTFGDAPWPAIVYFVCDENLNLYFISGKNDLHCKNISKNNRVACTIYDSSQMNAGKKIGVQFSGLASEVNTLEKVKWMIKMWNKLIAGKNGYRPEPGELLKTGGARVYKIAPFRVKFYNSRDFPKDKFKIVEF